MSYVKKYRLEKESLQQKIIMNGNILRNRNARNLDLKYLAFIRRICFKERIVLYLL